MSGKSQPGTERAKLEVCVQDCAGFAAAERGGADRVELCSSLGVGGLTPSAGMIEFAAGQSCKSIVLIRPRAGDFVFSAPEVDVMVHDIALVASRRLGGVAIGAAHPDGSLDLAVLERLVAAAGEMEVCLNRVFDLTPDPFEALEQAINLGVSRILTSGQQASAQAGQGVLAELVRRAGKRIAIMAGAGITPDHVAELVRKTGLDEVHGSCRAPHPSPSLASARFGFAGTDAGIRTDAHIVRAMIEQLESTVLPSS